MARGTREDTGHIVTRLFAGQRRGGQLLLQRLRGNWPAIVGEDFAARTRPAKIQRGTLWINVSDAAWSYELQFHKRELLASIHGWLDREDVTDLRFRVGDVAPLPGEREPSVPQERTAPRVGGGPQQALPAGLVAGPQAPHTLADAPLTPPAESMAGTVSVPAAGSLPAAEPLPTKPSPTAPRRPAAHAPSAQTVESQAEAVKAVEHAGETIGDDALRKVFVRSLSKQQRKRSAGLSPPPKEQS